MKLFKKLAAAMLVAALALTMVGCGGRNSLTDQIKNVLDCLFIRDPIGSEKGNCFSKSPAVIVDAHIGEGVKSENDGGIMLEKCCHIMRKRGIVITQHFTICSPTFGISAK